MSIHNLFKVLSTAMIMPAIIVPAKGIDAPSSPNNLTIPTPDNTTNPLRLEASKQNVLIGSGAINPEYLNEPKFAAVVAEQFGSISPENELKWSFIHPTKDHYNWDTIDSLVNFAGENDMVVKGHGLISSCCNPDYLLNITDPAAFRAAMRTHFEAIMHRYNSTVDRWDVISEALETSGGGLQHNAFYKALGPAYVADAFRIARAASPSAKLFLNENQVESLAGKRQELYDLVASLVKEGVPIDGVALQMHITLVSPKPGVLTDIVNSYKALGLEVSIAEMDVHVFDNNVQANIYGSVLYEALTAGITDISFWGFTDKHLYTWLPGAKPLMFDEQYHPKKAFFATNAALKEYASWAALKESAMQPTK
ncbi:glycosyl hydrolase family 10 protein [Boeremia exigua]|uniref:glycosyl hydrolase family 10 protein n=1 Tax=Boeremia exigua TaxID=749465 RepID=UPI001E8E5099|nr:glycosyl hydrolase family 10 protein [Boeremia exigua]KAH6622458.1 glycosyl hydrolase family 10 protein [Boeremia exigua]